MSKFSNLAKRLADKAGISQQDAELFIKKMFDVANQGLDADKQVKMKWLGTFKVTAVKDRESVDVNTGERIIIEGRDKITFTPDNILKEIVNKPFAQFETVVVNDGVEFDEIDRKFEAEAALDKAQEALASEENVAENASPVLESLATEPGMEPSETSDSLGSSEDSDEQVVNNSQPTAEVIDFLDESKASPISSEVVIVGTTEPVVVGNTEPVVPVDTEPGVSAVETVSLTAESQVRELQTSESQASELQEPEPQTSAPPTVAVEYQDSSRHVVLSRSLVVTVCVIFALLLGGIGWLAFNYGKMAAQRDQLTLQLESYRRAPVKKQAASQPSQPSQPLQPSQEEILRKKALEDSLRMAQASEAVKMAESSESSKDMQAKQDVSKEEQVVANVVQKQKKDLDAKDKTDRLKDKTDRLKDKADAKKKEELAVVKSADKYDQDVRVRTGAYRIVGVAEVVIAKAGQTVKDLSGKYLGPGMECYVEALNGTNQLKAGQKVKIPKLELKKKKK